MGLYLFPIGGTGSNGLALFPAWAGSEAIVPGRPDHWTTWIMRTLNSHPEWRVFLIGGTDEQALAEDILASVAAQGGCH